MTRSGYEANTSRRNVTPSHFVFGRGEGGVEVEPAAIIGDLGLACEIRARGRRRAGIFCRMGSLMKLCHGEIFGFLLFGAGLCQQFLGGIGPGFGFIGFSGGGQLGGVTVILQPFALKTASFLQQAAQFRQRFHRALVRVAVRLASPHGALVELDVSDGTSP